jgi:hypothetical protein
VDAHSGTQTSTAEAVAPVLALTRKASRDVTDYEQKMQIYGPRNLETSMARNQALLDQVEAEELCRSIPACRTTLLPRIESIVETIGAMPR